MEFIEFVGREFSNEILVEAGDFIVITFEDERNVRINISAWEIDGEMFDLFLVKENDVLEDRFREQGAYFSERGISDFEDAYSFDLKHKRCLILSNMRAISRDKLIKVHLIRVKPSELTGVQYQNVAVQSKEEQKARNINWINIVLFIILLICIGTVTIVLYFIHFILSTAFLAIIGFVMTITKENIRKILGL